MKQKIYRIKVKGSSRERGQQHGHLLGEPISNAIQFYQQMFQQHLKIGIHEIRRRSERYLDPLAAACPSVLDEIALPSCHAFFIFNVTKGKLNCHLTQRSGDIALGIPFNLACYATLTQMIAQETNLALGEFSHYINDAHIYVNHIEGLEEQITREPFPSPSLEITDKPFWDLKFEDFTLKNYEHHPVIKFPVAV